MKWMMIVVALFLMPCPLFARSPWADEAVREKPVHDRGFWREIAKNHYAVPEGQPVLPLLHELSGYLGSTDPELRDDLAYSAEARAATSF